MCLTVFNMIENNCFPRHSINNVVLNLYTSSEIEMNDYVKKYLASDKTICRGVECYYICENIC